MNIVSLSLLKIVFVMMGVTICFTPFGSGYHRWTLDKSKTSHKCRNTAWGSKFEKGWVFPANCDFASSANIEFRRTKPLSTTSTIPVLAYGKQLWSFALERTTLENLRWWDGARGYPVRMDPSTLREQRTMPNDLTNNGYIHSHKKKVRWTTSQIEGSYMVVGVSSN